MSSFIDPPARYVDGAAMDYFLIEAVATLRQSAAVASTRAEKIKNEMIEAGILPPPPPAKDQRDKIQPPDDEEEALRVRLEAIGMHVGANFSERLCKDKPLFTETLDAIKFVCKDLWAACWEKQVDNLRTNHRGVYVLQDNSFKPVARLSSWESREVAIKHAKTYAVIPAGIVRGALARLGYQSTVTAEITSLPQCTFQVKLPKSS